VKDEEPSGLFARVPKGVRLARRHQHKRSVRTPEHVVGDAGNSTIPFQDEIRLLVPDMGCGAEASVHQEANPRSIKENRPVCLRPVALNHISLPRRPHDGFPHRSPNGARTPPPGLCANDSRLHCRAPTVKEGVALGGFTCSDGLGSAHPDQGFW